MVSPLTDIPLPPRHSFMGISNGEPIHLAPGAGGACSFLCCAVRGRFVRGLVVFVVVVLMVVVGVVLVVVVLVGVGVMCRLYLIPLSCRMQQQRCPIQ